MTTLSFHDIIDRSDVQRWSLSAIFVAGVHVLLICTIVFWHASSPDAHGTGTQPMMIDLENLAPAPDAQKLDLAPGETARDAPPPTPEPVEKQVVEKKEEIAPTPLQDRPVVMLPPEQKEKPKPEQDKPKPVDKKTPSEPAATRNTAPRPASQAAMADYNGLLAAHIVRFNRDSPTAVAGTASVGFTLNRDGKVLSSSLVKSSGSPAQDAEALALVRRAQPYPRFLPGMTEDTIYRTVPVKFSQKR